MTLKWKKNSTVITVYRQEPKELGWGTKTGAPLLSYMGTKNRAPAFVTQLGKQLLSHGGVQRIQFRISTDNGVHTIEHQLLSHSWV